MADVDKRYQVFVSSTYQDLSEARQEVMVALLELDCIPAGMELFPAANDDQWTLIKKYIDDCDYYLVIIGGRYGSIGADGKSFTQMEYEYAVQQKKPVIAFLHKDPDKLEAGKVEKGEEGRNKLEAFRKLAQTRMCKFWTTPSDLGSVVSRSVVNLKKSNPAVGWVRADKLPEQGATEEILSLKRQLETLQAELTQSRGTSALKLESLAQGQDRIDVKVEYNVHFKDTYKIEGHIADGSFSWDQLFAAVSPAMIGGLASDNRLKQALSSYLGETLGVELGQSDQYKAHSLTDLEVSEPSFDTIKIQFVALGLIARSSRRDGYWVLTSLGERSMFALRAIQKKNTKKSR